MKQTNKSHWITLGLVLVTLALASNLPGQERGPSNSPQPAAKDPCHVDQQTLQLEYKDKPKPGASPKPIRGGSLVGAMNGVAEAISQAGSPDPNAPPTASTAIKVDAYLNQTPGKPPTLSLKAQEMGSQNDPKMSGATRSALEREKKLVMDNLKKWTHQLSAAEIQKLQETGELPIDLSDQLGKLSQFSKPKLTLKVSGDCSPASGPATAASTDPKTGVTTTSVDNPDGSRTVTRTGKDGKVISTEQVPTRGSGTATASTTDPATGIRTASVENPDGSRTITRTDKDGKVISTEQVPAKGSGATTASATDPATGITTTSVGNPDGSRMVTRTDKDGNVLSNELIPPKGKGLAIASSTDPKTGITTTSTEAPDGTHIITTSQTHNEPDGSKRITSTDDQGNRTETTVRKDGSTTATQTTTRGDTITTNKTPDGKVTVVENKVEGGKTTTQRDPNGQTVTEKFDANGARTEKITRSATGEETREDNRGNVTKVSTEGERTTETTTDRRGNSTTITRDANGEVVARTENQVTPKEPGQRYFETVLKGDDWDSLPASLKNRYAGSERSIQETQEMRDLQQRQEADRVRVEEEQRKYSAELQAGTDAKLAAIQKEKEAADRQMAERAARENRQRAIQESHETAARLNREHAEAVARGDKTAASRIDHQQDELEKASSSLLEFTEEETRAMESKQAARDRINSEIVASARAAAQTKVDQDWEQGLKEDVTAGTKYISVGSAMQQETKKSTRVAEFEAAFAENKNEMLEKRYNDPKTTVEEKEVIRDMMELAEVQRSGAYEQLASNRNLTTAGYAIDVAMIAAGGPVTKGLGAVLGKVGQRSVAELAGTTTLSAVQRFAGKQAAESLAAHSAAASATASAAAARVTNSAVGKVLSTDIATGAVGESRWLTQVAQNTARDTAIGAGAQVALTGEINLHDLAMGAAAGGLVNGVLVGARGPEARADAPSGAPRPAEPVPMARPREVASTNATGAAPPTRPATTTERSVSTAGSTETATSSAARPPQPNAPREVAPNTTARDTGVVEQAAPARETTRTQPTNESATGRNPAAPNEQSAVAQTQPNAPREVAPNTTTRDTAIVEQAAPARETTRTQPTNESTTGRNPAAPNEQSAVAQTQPNAPRPAEPNRGHTDTQTDHAVRGSSDQPATQTSEANAGRSAQSAAAEKPRIVRPGDPDFKPQQAAAAPAPEAAKPPVARSAETLTNPRANQPNQPAAAAPRQFDPNTRTAASARPNDRASATTPQQVRELVPRNAREQFDQGMAAVDRIVQQDPRFANVDRTRVAEQMAVRAGSMKPEAAAALALNYQAHNGARVTPEALSNATGIPRAEAESAVRAGWDAVQYNPGDINNPVAPSQAAKPNPPRPPESGPPPPGSSEAKTEPLPQGRAAPNKPAEAPPSNRVSDENAFAANNRRPSEVPNQEKPATTSKPNESLKVEEFDPNAPEPETAAKPPKVEEFNPNAPDPPTNDPARAALAKLEADADAYARKYSQAADESIRKPVEAARAKHEARAAEAQQFGTFKDSPDLNATGAAALRRANVRKLIPGDGAYLERLMGGVKLPFPDGKSRPIKSSQLGIGAEPANDFAVKILNSEPGRFPPSIENPGQKIEIYPDGTIGEGGHHRMVGAALASEMTGRPLYGSPNAIIPADEIKFVPQGARAATPNWNLKVESPRDVPGSPLSTQVELKQRRAAELRRQAADAQKGESETDAVNAERLSRQAEHLEWEARTIGTTP